MKYKRKIKFDYYTVCIVNDKEGTDPVRFDFQSWLEKADEIGIRQQEIEKDGIIARLEEVVSDKENNLWKMRFMKLRDTNIPSIVKRDTDAKPIELSEDEYIGEDLLMIYDPSNQVAMLQRNRFAMTKGRLERILNKVWDSEDERIVLMHIGKNVNINEIAKKSWRCLEVRLANIHKVKDNTRPLQKIINSYYEMGSKAGIIRFSLGRGSSKMAGLNPNQIPIMLDDIYENIDMVSAAEIHIKDDDASPVDVVDLMNTIMYDYIDFNLEKRTALEFEYASRLMESRYLKRRPEINKVLE